VSEDQPVTYRRRPGRRRPGRAKSLRRPETAAEEALVRRYRTGMRGLGILLMVVGIPGLLVALGLAAMMMALVSGPGAIGIGVLVFLGVGLIIGLPLLLGILALGMRNWVNWVVAVVGGLVVFFDALGIASGAGLDIANILGTIVVLALAILAVCNIGTARRLARIGLNPRRLALAASPRARARR
jgi:hypothetical protein